MEMPRGLLIILALLSLGFCSDVSIITHGGPSFWIALLLLLGRIAAIGGILMRTRNGWWLAMGFFALLILLNLQVLLVMGQGVLGFFGLLIAVICLLYLLGMRTEFE